MIDNAFPYCKIDDSVGFLGFLGVLVVWKLAGGQKVRTKRFYTPPFGGKKRQAVFGSPKKNLL